jgi:hypothetical protein
MRSTGTTEEQWQNVVKRNQCSTKINLEKKNSTNPGKISCYWYSIQKVVRSLATQYGMSGVTMQVDIELLKVPP